MKKLSLALRVVILTIGASLPFVAFSQGNIPGSEQNRLDIQVDIKNYHGQTMILGYYQGDQQYVKDTLKVVNGKARISNPTEYEGGFYLISVRSIPLFDVILSQGDQKFSIQINMTSDTTCTQQIVGSTENTLWNDYLNFLKAKREEVQSGKDAASVDKLVKERQQKIISDYPHSLTAKVISSSLMPTFPGYMGKENQLYYYKAHFFDGLDFSDSRLVRSSILYGKYAEYLKLTPNVPDSLNGSVDNILRKAVINKDVYAYSRTMLLNHFATSKVMGHDEVYAHIAEHYYCNPHLPFEKPALDAQVLSRLCETATRIQKSIVPKVLIGKQVWMTKNLDVDKFRNGDAIPQAKTAEDWKRAGLNKQPAWCYYKNDAWNGGKYGRLYNWYAVNDPRGLAPEGWHVPSDAEWTILEDYLTEYYGKLDFDVKRLKSQSGWAECAGESGNGTNETGFSGLPGGGRLTDGKFYDEADSRVDWWSASEDKNDTSCAWSRGLGNCFKFIYRNADVGKNHGFYVRCIKD